MSLNCQLKHKNLLFLCEIYFLFSSKKNWKNIKPDGVYLYYTIHTMILYMLWNCYRGWLKQITTKVSFIPTFDDVFCPTTSIFLQSQMAKNDGNKLHFYPSFRFLPLGNVKNTMHDPANCTDWPRLHF